MTASNEYRVVDNATRLVVSTHLTRIAAEAWRTAYQAGYFRSGGKGEGYTVVYRHVTGGVK